ncbi:hypothetical protein ACA910_002668 [Epithemia clementina (nom. ined.)]
MCHMVHGINLVTIAIVFIIVLATVQEGALEIMKEISGDEEGLPNEDGSNEDNSRYSHLYPTCMSNSGIVSDLLGQHSQHSAMGSNQCRGMGQHSQHGGLGQHGQHGGLGQGSQHGVLGQHSQHGGLGQHSQQVGMGQHSQQGGLGHVQAGVDNVYAYNVPLVMEIVQADQGQTIHPDTSICTKKLSYLDCCRGQC